MSEEVTVKISMGTETLFECSRRRNVDTCNDSPEQTSALVSALNYIQSEVNRFLTDLITQQGKSSEADLSENDPDESEDEEKDRADSSFKGRKRPPNNSEVKSGKLLKISRKT